MPLLDADFLFIRVSTYGTIYKKKTYPCDALITYNVNTAVRIGTGREKTIINKRVERTLAS